MIEKIEITREQLDAIIKEAYEFGETAGMALILKQKTVASLQTATFVILTKLNIPKP